MRLGGYLEFGRVPECLVGPLVSALLGVLNIRHVQGLGCSLSDPVMPF